MDGLSSQTHAFEDRSEAIIAPATHCYNRLIVERTSETDVVAALRARGLRMTPQRRAIVAEIMRSQGHISPTALARKVQADMPGVNASTIYRTLSMLEEMGVLAHAHLESGAEYHRAEDAGHVHLTCSNCGDEDDLSLEEAGELVRLIERHHGFEPDLTHFAIGGLCADCRKAGGLAV
jgi:Fur family transcriptional regulator, ferric uptake regulator